MTFRKLCDHCGLPVGVVGYQPDESHCFCCYGCFLVARIVGNQGQSGAPAWLLLRLGVGAFLAMNVMMISLLLYSEAIQDIGEHAESAFRWGLLALSTPALIILGHPFVAGMAREMRRLSPSIDSLVALGSLTAYGVSALHVVRGSGPVYFDTATMLLLLVTLGRLLEATSKSRTAGLVKGLLEIRAPVATVLRDGGEAQVPVDEVLPGDRVRVRPGERIPVDGKIVAGATTINEASFTGEPHPRACAPGSDVIGGSVNVDGDITVLARAVGEGSLLGQIVRLVEQSAAARAPVERLADRVSSAFVPAVVLAAAGSLAYWGYGHHDLARGGMSALAVLVVACPCALGIATPLVTSLAIGRAAREGVLIRSGEVLEVLPRVRRVFFDKTGTLTRGTMTVTGVEVVGEAEVGSATETPRTTDEALAWVATLESASEHPVGKAIVAEAQRRGIALGSVRDFRAAPGQGASGVAALDGAEREIMAGTAEFVGATGAREDETAAVYATLGHSPVIRITLADTLRPEAPGAIRALSDAGIRVAMLSGDTEASAAAIARQAGISEVFARCLPDAKITAVRTAKQSGEFTAMVGDGINDAPALAEADVAIALAGGTDLAREAGDVTLIGDELSRIPWTLGLARLAYKVIRQNLFWAFGYNAVAMAIAFFGHLHPLIAALAMLGSSLFVLSNSVRVARYP